METLKAKKQSPFFELLNDAEKIQVREMKPENGVQVISSIQKALKHFDRSEDWEDHSFFVQIKTPKHLKDKKEAATALPESREALLSHAHTLLHCKDYFLARNIYSFLLKKNIRDKESLLGLGICLFRLKEWPAAKKCFQACNEVFKMEAAKVWLGLCFAEENQDEAAVRLLESVQNLDAMEEELKFSYLKALGNCQTRLGEWEKAASLYEAALTLIPDSDTVHVNLGTLEFQRKHFDLSYVHFKRAIEINPQNARAYCGMGLLHLEQNFPQLAEKDFLKALDFEPSNIVAILELIHLADQSNQYSKVKVRLVKWLLQEPKNSEVRYLLASCLFKEKDYFGAEREVDFILKTNPQFGKAIKLKTELKEFVHCQGRIG